MTFFFAGISFGIIVWFLGHIIVQLFGPSIWLVINWLGVSFWASILVISIGLILIGISVMFFARITDWYVERKNNHEA